MNLINIYKNSVRQYNDKIALVVEGIPYSYTTLDNEVVKIAALLHQYSSQNVGIFAYRSLSVYTGILATLQVGKTYVPLNPKFPIQRNLSIIKLANLKLLIIDRKCIKHFNEIADLISNDVFIIAPELTKQEIPEKLNHKFRIYTKTDFNHVYTDTKAITPSTYAYIMFTSGSTGIPKGIGVGHNNVLSYIEYLYNRYTINPEDKFSQTFDITFDLSVHDMFLAWRSGASLYCIPETQLMAPAKFIKENQLTVWFSVPSLALFMQKFRMLKKAAFPSLKLSLFCGEPLPKSLVVDWQKAAPNSIIENIYGPTETTIGITHYRVPNNPDEILTYNDIVSIGQVFSTQDYCIVNNKNEQVNDYGELCLSGSQITSGYLNNSEKTKEVFVKFNNDHRIWYKTGDIVKLKDNHLFYINRKDFQVKIRGYRVELEEINYAIKKITKSNIVVSIPYPLTGINTDSIYSFVYTECKLSEATIISELNKQLPNYMIPKKIIFIDEFPLNSNGKINKKRLEKYIKDEK